MDEIHDIQNQDMPTEQEIKDLKKALTRRFVPMPDIDEAWDDCLRRIGKPTRRTVRLRFIYSAIAAAAAAVVLLLAFVKGDSVEQDNTEADNLLFAAVTAPADVTVTTDDGDKAVDDQQPLSFSQQRTAKVENVTVTMPRGKDMTLELPDGTKVWLNTDTRLTFPSQFVAAKREVHLAGEAYFEVKPDKRHPFIVHTESLVTQVLGTSFDVRAYSGSQPVVVLIEGSVAVSSLGAKKSMTMKPGELARLSASGAIDIFEVDTYPYTQWREGFFYFNNVEAREILKEIGRWYNVSIVVESPEKLARRLHFVAERDSSLRSTMSHLNGLGDMEIEIRENTIIVK